MMRLLSSLFCSAIMVCFLNAGCDSLAYSTQFIEIDKDVKLEVLDWGGTGRPIVLLTGGNTTAIVYYYFAQKLTPNYHVYGITRRGFGNSSAPESGYQADQLADDVLAVIDVLKLVRPILVGHSIAGEELSSIGSRYPEKVAGLIYLDAAYAYAFYQPGELPSFDIDFFELQRKMEKLRKGEGNSKQLVQELLETDLPLFKKGLEEIQKRGLEHLIPKPSMSVNPEINRKITAGMQRYTSVKVPVLAICAGSSDYGRGTNMAECDKQKSIVERSTLSAKFVILPDAKHNIFATNEEDVLREMNAFIKSLN